MTQDAARAAGTSSEDRTVQHRNLSSTAPSLPLMYLGLLLTGLGTMLLGPILPLLSHHWGLTDAQSGAFLLAQFCGAFVGGISISSRLRRDLLVGFVAAAVGLAGFALASVLPWAYVGLFVGGAGIGRTITAINILAGQRFTNNRGPAIMLLNFTWSFGAMLSPLLAAWVTPMFALRSLLLAFAGFFAVCVATMLVEAGGNLSESVRVEQAASKPASGRVFFYFCAMMVLYGGLETCLSGWLTTYALRYGTVGLRLSRGELTLLLLLIGLTAGRAVSSYLLLRMPEARLQRIALGLSAVFTAALATAHGSGAIAGFSVLLGLSLSPVFPSMFSLFMGHGPTARQAGVMIAVSALGAAALPWAMGQVSTVTGSLQVALALPVGAAVAMLGMSLVGVGRKV